MTAISPGMSLQEPGVRALGTSKLKMFHVSEAPEELYQSYLDSHESLLKSRYSSPSADFFKSPTYVEYAQVKVAGKTVATVFNSGGVRSSNALGGKIGELVREADKAAGALQGPLAAQARAEKIAEALGGTVAKSSTAMTQAEFHAAPKARFVVDYEAMRADPAFEQLQKTKEARTLFLAQQAAQ